MAQNLVINILAKDKTKQAFGVLKTRLGSLKRSIFSVQTALVGIGAGLVVRNLVGTGKELENLRVRLKFLLKDTNEGAKAFDNMTKFASKVPFSLEEIQGGAGILATVTDNADDLQKMLEITGNVASVTGLDFRTAGEQIQRSFSAGIGSADIFREKGVRNMLGFKAGATVSIEETVKAFERVFGKDGRFGNATDELAQTFAGTLSMIGDKIFNFKKVLLEAGFFDELKKQFGDLDKFLEDNAKQLDEIATSVGKNLAQGMITVVNVGKELIPTIKKIGSGLKSIFDGFMAMPEFVREVGIVGAFLFGKKGAVALAGVSFLIDKIQDFVNETSATTGLIDLENLTQVQERLTSVNKLLEDQKKLESQTLTVAGGKIELSAEELGINEDLRKSLEKEKKALEEILSKSIQINTHKKFIHTTVKNIHEAHISSLEVEKKALAINKKLSAVFKNIHEAHLKHKKNVEAENSLRMEVLDKLTKQNEEFSLSQEIFDGINNGVSSMARGLAQSLILGKSMNETFKQFAQNLLVEIIAKTIERIALLTIEELFLNKLFKKKQNELTLMHRQESSLKRQIGLQAILLAMGGGGGGLPFFHKGGAVSKGQPIVVGERGAEVFVPNSSGQITQSARGTGTGGATTVNFNITTVDARGFDELLIARRGTISRIINESVNERGREALI